MKRQPARAVLLLSYVSLAALVALLASRTTRVSANLADPEWSP